MMNKSVALIKKQLMVLALGKRLRLFWGRCWSYIALRFSEGIICRQCRRMIFLVNNPLGQDPRCYVRRGEIVLFMGMWRTETMEKWSRRLIDHNSENAGKLIILEGSSKNCEILAFEARRRNIKNVLIVNKALWSSRTELTFSIKRITDANYIKESNVYSKLRNLDAEDFTDEDITVQADTVDSILEGLNINHIDHVHMTIGGSEVEAIKGMKRLFAKRNIRLYCKSILSYKETDTPLYLKIIEILSKYGMECHMINKDRGKAGKRIYGFF